MLRLSFHLVCALTLLMLASPSSAIDYAGSVKSGDSANAWFDKEKANHPDWETTEKISGPMSQILNQALVDFGSYKPGSACNGAAAAQGWYVLADAAHAGPLDAFLDAIKGSLKGIHKVATFGADPSAAAGAIETGKLIDKAFEEAKSKGTDWLKKRLKDIWSGKKLEVLKRPFSNETCSGLLVAVWDPGTGTYDIVIYGDCGCKKVGGWALGSSGTALKTWAVHLRGTVTPDDQDGQWVYHVGFPTIDVVANCGCGDTGTSTTPTPPPQPERPKDWGTYKTCADCQSYLDQIRAVQAERDKMDSEYRDADGRLDSARNRLANASNDKEKAAAQADINKALEDVNALYKRDAGLLRLLEDLWDRLKKCVVDKCQHGHSSVPRELKNTLFNVGIDKALRKHHKKDSQDEEEQRRREEEEQNVKQNDDPFH